MKLGDRMRSVVSGFEGIATAYVVYLNGCERFLLQPPVDEKGQEQSGIWFDVPELVVVVPGEVRLEPRADDSDRSINFRDAVLKRSGVTSTSGGGANPPKR